MAGVGRYGALLVVLWPACSSAATFSGRVVDGQDHALAAARVWLCRAGDDLRPAVVLVAETQSGPDGAFTLADPNHDSLPYWQTWYLYAHVQGQALGVVTTREPGTFQLRLGKAAFSISGDTDGNILIRQEKLHRVHT